MAALTNPRTPRDGMPLDSADVRQFIIAAGGTVIGDLAVDFRTALATVNSISEADANKIGIADMWQRHVDAGFPEGIAKGPDIDTFSFTRSASLSSVAGDPQDVFIDSTGVNCVILSDTPDQTVASFTLSTAWDISTLGGVDSELTPLNRSFGLCAKDDGTKIYTGQLNGNIAQYTLTTPWLWSSATITDFFLFSTPSSDLPFALHLSPEGTKMLVGGNSTSVYMLTMSTPFDLTSISYDAANQFDAAAQITSENFGLTMGALGERMYLADHDSQLIYQYNLSTAYDLTSAVYASKSLSTGANGPTGIHLDGARNTTLIGVHNDSTAALIRQYDT